jgi:hypothetical protein
MSEFRKKIDKELEEDPLVNVKNPFDRKIKVHAREVRPLELIIVPLGVNVSINH